MEAGFTFMIALVTLAIGIIVGMVLKSATPTKAKSQGVIYAYYYEGEDKPSLLLEGSVPVEDIVSRKHALFDVVVVKQNSQK